MTDQMRMYGFPDYCVAGLKDGEHLDPVLLELKVEKAAAQYIKSFLELEGNPATIGDIQLLTTGRFRNLPLETTLTERHIEEIWGMNKAIKYLLEHYSEPLSPSHLKTYNEMVEVGARKKFAGELRNTDVTISGTHYRPPQFELLPRMFDHMFEAIGGLQGVLNRSVSVLLGISKSQFFIDGNKRTARLASLHTCLNGGQRFLSFDLDTGDYMQALKQFYETGDTGPFVTHFMNNLISSP